MDLLYVASGALVGTLVGATGVGGGSLMTPILVLVFGVSPGTAVGTDLLFAAITKGFGTALHGLNKSVNWNVVARLAFGSLPASFGTLLLLHYVLDPRAVRGMMTTGLGTALVVTALAIFLQPLFRKASGSEQTDVREALARQERNSDRPVDEDTEAPRTIALTIIMGAVVGTLVTLTSVGAGALGVMVLFALYPRIKSVKIVGIDIAHAVPLTAMAGLGHASLGGVDFRMLSWLLLGSLPGIAVGSQLAFRLPERIMKRLLAAILLVVGAKLLV